MTALPRRQYRDPLEQMIEAEEEGCKGCRWRTPDGDITRCRNPLVPNLLAERRCDDYEDNA